MRPATAHRPSKAVLCTYLSRGGQPALARRTRRSIFGTAARMSRRNRSDSVPVEASPAVESGFRDAVGPVTPVRLPRRRRFDRTEMPPEQASARRQAAAGVADEKRNALTFRDGPPLTSSGYALSSRCFGPAESGPSDASGPRAQVGPEDVLFWKRDGVQNRVLQRLKKGAYPISGTLDLHGRTVARAQEDILRCIAAAAAEGHRCLLIVHGKSASAAAPARLKNCVNAWLRQHPQVNAFHSARPQHGGAGALYVLIGKRKPKAGLPEIQAKCGE